MSEFFAVDCLLKKETHSDDADVTDADDLNAISVSIQGKAHRSKHTFTIKKVRPYGSCTFQSL